MSQSMRITDHPILGADDPKKKVTIYYEGTPIEANEGEPIAIALANAGIKATIIGGRYGLGSKDTPPASICGQGRCGSCRMIVDGVPDVKTCSTPVKDGMIVQVQHGLA